MVPIVFTFYENLAQCFQCQNLCLLRSVRAAIKAVQSERPCSPEFEELSKMSIILDGLCDNLPSDIINDFRMTSCKCS